MGLVFYSSSLYSSLALSCGYCSSPFPSGSTVRRGAEAWPRGAPDTAQWLHAPPAAAVSGPDRGQSAVPSYSHHWADRCWVHHFICILRLRCDGCVPPLDFGVWVFPWDRAFEDNGSIFTNRPLLEVSFLEARGFGHAPRMTEVRNVPVSARGLRRAFVSTETAAVLTGQWGVAWTPPHAPTIPLSPSSTLVGW